MTPISKPTFLLLAAVATICACGCDNRRQADAPPRPNVVLISVDTLRADHVGCYGYAREATPELDKFAERSVRFANAFAQASWTLPSHMCMMTSQYPHIHGVETDKQALADETVTVAEVLGEHGYETGAVISWTFVSKKYGFAQGFDEFEELLPPPHLVNSETTASYKAEEVTNHAIRWLQRERDKPFFLFVHYFDPHINYAPPPPFDRMFVENYQGLRRGSFKWLRQHIRGARGRPATISDEDLKYVEGLYDGEIRYTDTHVGRLLAAIEAQVGLEDTLIIFTSDHGEEFNDHGSMEGHQWTLYDEVLHVPFLVHLPGDRNAGTVIDTPIELIDIPTMVCGVLRVPTPAGFQGLDRLNLLAGEDEALAPRRMFAEIDRHNRKQSLRTERYKLIHTDDIGVNKRGIPVTPGYELYDLAADPAEQENLFDASNAEHEALVKILEDWKATTAPTPGAIRTVELSDAERRRIESLGYVGGDDDGNEGGKSP